MTSQQARKLAEHDEWYMAEQRRQDAYYEPYENGTNDPDEIPDIDENLLHNLERRKTRNTCTHCKGNIVNGDIRAHVANCAETQLNIEKRRQKIIDLGRSSIGARQDIVVATSSVEKNQKLKDKSIDETLKAIEDKDEDNLGPENSVQPIPEKARVKRPIEDNANSDSSGEISFKPPNEVS